MRRPIARSHASVLWRHRGEGRSILLAITAPLIAAIIFAAIPAAGQPARGAAGVESYTLGTGANAGYGLEYLPGSVLGFPDTTARAGVATIDPRQIFGLGVGGMIVLRFDPPIVDRPGPDFTIFENAFTYTMGGKERTYAEPGAVAVSRDGSAFVEYSFDSLTLAGCAGVMPTNGDRDPADPSVSGGDIFDLATLGADSIRYVRIRDVTAMVIANRAHPFWDMTLTGFDLDAIVALHPAGPAAAPTEAGGGAAFTAAIYPNPMNASGTLMLRLGRPALVRARAIDGLGREARSFPIGPAAAGEHRVRLDVAGLPAGIYLIAIDLDGLPAGMIRTVIAP